MSRIPHQVAADNYIVLLGVYRPCADVELIVHVAEELVSPGGELTVVHLEATIHGLMLQGRIPLHSEATPVD